LYQAFQWYHDPFLSKQKETERDEFLKELNQIVENLKSNIAFVENTIEKLNAAELTIGKRLEWAAGSSTNLLDTLKAFESLRKNRNDYFKNDVKLARSIETFAENLNDFEQMRISNSTNQIEKFQLLENVLIE
jgi:prefoldin subunit 5